MKCLVLATLLSAFHIICVAQNIGIGVQSPTEKLEINGNIKASGIILSNGGTSYDFLMTKAATGEVGYKKGHGAVGINYIICLNGNYPSQVGTVASPWLGEIRMFAGNFPPHGWAFCQGQPLPIAQNTNLFSLIGTYYGGDGQTNFALPDLRGAVPVSAGISPAGYQWIIGQKSN